MTEPLGKVNVSDEVVSTIAHLAAVQVPGIAGMSESIASGLAKILGQTDASKGVKVTIGEKNDVVIEISVVIESGNPIPSVTSQLQRAVKDEVESMTGLEVVAVNIQVTGMAAKKVVPSAPAPKVQEITEEPVVDTPEITLKKDKEDKPKKEKK